MKRSMDWSEMGEMACMAAACIAEEIGCDGDAIEPSSLRVFSHPQVWPSTSCGFGGIGGSAMTEAQTVVFMLHQEGAHYASVFHGTRYAYTVKLTGPDVTKFYDLMHTQRLPGAAKGWTPA